MIHVLVVDDHPVVRAGLRMVLESESDLQVVGEASDGAEALALVEALDPDVVLMDLQMPVLDGVEATTRIVGDHPRTHVVVLTTYDTDRDIVRAVQAGATGYLLKDAAPDELYRAVRAGAAGKSMLAPRVASRVMERTRTHSRESLTEREIEVLRYASKGHTNRQVAGQLHISEATVKTHLLHIFDKLGVDDRTRAVTVALEQGILRLET